MHFCCYMNAEASLYKKIQCYVIYFSIYLPEVWKKSIWFGQHCFFLHVIQSQLVEKETEFQYPILPREYRDCSALVVFVP
jgi:hypothetical protein